MAEASDSGPRFLTLECVGQKREQKLKTRKQKQVLRSELSLWAPWGNQEGYPEEAKFEVAGEGVLGKNSADPQ